MKIVLSEHGELRYTLEFEQENRVADISQGLSNMSVQMDYHSAGQSELHVSHLICGGIPAS